MPKTFKGWLAENAKYTQPKDMDAWLEAAWEAGHAVAQAEAKPAPEPFGYVSEHNCEGPFQFQFHKSQASVYWDNCKVVTAVYRAPAAPAPAWQPIETAPDSGVFLVYMPDERTKFQVAKFHPNVRVIGNCFAFDITKPTHWMPLPEAPTSKETT
jgi:hypothetical protein